MMSIYNYYIFEISSKYGYIDILKYLNRTSKYIIVPENSYYKKSDVIIISLSSACRNSHIETAKWIYNTYKNIIINSPGRGWGFPPTNDIQMDYLNRSEQIFYLCFIEDKRDICVWLYSIQPDINLYKIFTLQFSIYRTPLDIYLISLFVEKKPSLNKLCKKKIPSIYKKICFIQNWWKNIIYNAHSKIGREFGEKQIEWAFS